MVGAAVEAGKMACKGCAYRRKLAADAIRKLYAKAQVIRQRKEAKKGMKNAK